MTKQQRFDRILEILGFATGSALASALGLTRKSSSYCRQNGVPESRLGDLMRLAPERGRGRDHCARAGLAGPTVRGCGGTIEVRTVHLRLTFEDGEIRVGTYRGSWPPWLGRMAPTACSSPERMSHERLFRPRRLWPRYFSRAEQRSWYPPGPGRSGIGWWPWAGRFLRDWPLPPFTRVTSMTAEQMRRPVVRPLWGSRHSRGAGLVARTYAAWKDCRISLSRAAQLLNWDRSTVRWRFADLAPDFAAWRERKRAASRGRAAARGAEATA